MTLSRRLGWSFLLLALAPVGCFQSGDNVGSDMVDEQTVHQSLHLTHHAAADATQVFARFRVGGGGGTNLNLVPPSGVTADGKAMTAQDGVVLSDTLPGRCYGVALDGFRPQVEVKFTGRSGTVYANTLRVERADFEKDQAKEWSRSRGVTVPFAGPPLQEGESVVLSVEADAAREGGPKTATASASTPGATAVTLRAEDLARLANGGAKAAWVRMGTRPLQQATPTGGELVSNYYSKPLAVTLVD